MWLELRDAARSFGERRALDGVSFGLAEGEIGCLLGPSGCGKTTALRCIAGFEALDSGSVLSRGRVLTGPGQHVPPHERGIGLVFQDLALFPHLTVRGNVEFGLQRMAADARRERTNEMLALVGLGDHGSAYPEQLSGGQQQRVALVRALAPRPSTVLLDEPFSSLDVALRERLVRELRVLLRSLGTTALVVTHDQQDAFALADRVGLMREGRLEQWGAPYDLYHRPRTRFAAQFVGDACFIPGTRAEDGCIDTELGTLCGAPRPGPRAELVDVLLRPDDVVHDDHAGLKVRIVDRVFRGAEFLYALELPSGRRILALVPSHHDHPVGEEIGIRVASQHVVTFPAGAGDAVTTSGAT